MPRRVAGHARGAGGAGGHAAMLRVGARRRRNRGHGGGARAHAPAKAPARLHRQGQAPPSAGSHCRCC